MLKSRNHSILDLTWTPFSTAATSPKPRRVEACSTARLKKLFTERVKPATLALSCSSLC